MREATPAGAIPPRQSPPVVLRPAPEGPPAGGRPGASPPLEAVTVLFTDLVDSTATASRLPADAAARLRHEHFTAVVRAIDASSGRLVKNLGDGVMATFPSATAGLRCAVAIQQRLQRRNRRAEHPLHIRIGLSAGDVEPEDGDYFGQAVVEAARLCAEASAGQILCAQPVLLLSGGRNGFEVREAGPLSLKGLPDRDPAFEVCWKPAAPKARLPLPHRLGAARAVPHCGRRPELEHLEEVIARAGGGSQLMAVVLGEPGSGKTRLAIEAGRLAHARGSTVLHGRCSETPLLPYEPFVQALQHWSEQQAGALGRWIETAPELARLLPSLGLEPGIAGEAAATEEAPTHRYRLFDAVSSLLAELADEAPLVLLIDDLQWADPATELLLAYLLRSGDAPLAVVATVRRDPASGLDMPGVVADLAREGVVRPLVLQPMSTTELGLFVEATVGRRPEEAFVAALHDKTDGNPYFAGEILRELAVPDGCPSADSLAEIGVPDSVKPLILRRVHALGEGAHDALTAAAVIGRRFPARTLERVSGRFGDELQDHLETAVRAGLLAESPEEPEVFTFVHALARDALYENLLPTRRRLLHRAAAEAVECEPRPHSLEHLAATAHHFAHAGGDDGRGKALGYAIAAGDQACAMYAYEDAARHYTAALRLVDAVEAIDGRSRADIGIRLGEAQARAGDAAAARLSFADAAAIARDDSDPALLAQAALGLAGGLTGFSPRGVADPAVLAVLAEALQALGDEPMSLRAQVLARLAVERHYADPQRQDGRDLAHEARTLARRTGDPAVELAALCARQYTLLGPRVREQLEAAREIASLARRRGHRDMEFRGQSFAVGPLLALGSVDRAEAAIATCAALAEDLRHPAYRWEVGVFRAMLALLRGDLREGERLAVEAHELGGRAGHAETALNQFGGQLLLLRWAQGRLDEMAAAARQFAGELPTVREWQVVLPFLFAEMGELDEARAAFEQLAAHDFEDLPQGGRAWLFNMAVLASSCASVGDERRAALLYDLIEPHADLFAVDLGGAPICLGSLESSLGMLAGTVGWLDRADDHFRRAHERNAAVGARPFAMMTVRHHLDLLARRRAPGDEQRAGELRSSARRVCRELGFRSLEAQIGGAAQVSAPVAV